MRKQQRIWEEEHRVPSFLPSYEYEEPATSVVLFSEFLKLQGIVPPKKIVDIGVGKGRNAIFLAKQGFEVYGMDYVLHVLTYVKQKARNAHVLPRIHLRPAEIDAPWPFEDNYFDIAIDCFSSIDVETEQGRIIYRNEMFRTLKPGGYALVTVVATDDEIEGEFIKKHPGKERNSVIWPSNGKFQKNYEEQELKRFYDNFKVVELRNIKKRASKLGREYNASSYWLILQKEIKNT